MSQLLIGLLIGGVPGFYLGRWRAEVGRARHDARRTWETRSSYRNSR